MKSSNKRIKIFKSKVIFEENVKKPNQIGHVNDEFIVKCGKDSIQIIELQLEGKERMKAIDFLNGLKLKISFWVMFRVKLVEYDGSNYVGWQRQNNGKSIQEEIEKSLHKIFNKKIELTVAGRTDAGVMLLVRWLILT